MEQTNLTTISQTLSATKLKQAQNIIIRDIDEETKNNFVAYADDKDQSHDVSLQLDVKKNILSSSCDCGQAGVCVHQTAFMLHLANNNPKTKTTVSKRKKTESELILDQLDADALRLWAATLFKKNKDIEFLFINEFSKSETSFNQAEAKIIIDKAIKSVIKTKKKIDATELKRIIDALTVSLQPVLDYCRQKIEAVESQLLLVFIYGQLLEFDSKKNIAGVRMLRFVEKIYKDTNYHIHTIQDNERWNSLALQFINNFFNGKPVYAIEADLLIHFYDSNHSQERKMYFAAILLKTYEVLLSRGNRYNTDIQCFFIKVFAENKLFKTFYESFKPIRYENQYNHLLIEKLVEINKTDLAIRIAKEQIEFNVNEKYDIEYYKILAQIYQKTGNNTQLALMQSKTIATDFSIDSYLFLKKNLPADDYQKMRNKLLAGFKVDFHRNPKFVKSYFDILNLDKEYDKMIATIDADTPFEQIFDFKEVLYKHDKIKLLEKLMNVGRYNYYSKTKLSLEYEARFIVWIKENYDSKTISSEIQRKKIFGLSDFMKELEAQL